MLAIICTVVVCRLRDACLVPTVLDTHHNYLKLSHNHLRHPSEWFGTNLERLIRAGAPKLPQVVHDAKHVSSFT